jgi:hypothetical protein
MSDPEPYLFSDYVGDTLAIRPQPEDFGPGVIIETIYGHEKDGAAVFVPPHKLAEVTAALWRAAGQEVPELPVIHDEAAVRGLGRLLDYARNGTMGSTTPVPAWASAQARILLAHGVTLPEVTR